MPEEMRPASKKDAPDPSRSYERAQPESESGMGRLDNNRGTPTKAPDQVERAVTHKQQHDRQLNAHDVVNEREEAPDDQPDHSMEDEEPLGWDQAPNDLQNPRYQRHPRTEGKGGTP